MRCGCCAAAADYGSVAAAGFDGIELPGKMLAEMPEEAWEELLGDLSAGPIPCLGCNAALPPSVRICGPGFDPEVVEQYARQLCARVGRLGGRVIGIGSPLSRTLPTGFDTALAWRQAAEFLAVFAREARPWGITVCWETLNASETNFGVSFLEDTAVVRRLASDGVDNLGLVADLFHLLVNGNTADDVAGAVEWIRHVHIAQPPVTLRGYPTEDYAPQYKALLTPILDFGACSTISIEAFHGTVVEDGPKALALLRSLAG